MNTDYLKNIALLKALADPSRLLIIETLSRNENCTCGEYCACNLLGNLNITQPTLSHHMKILCHCGITVDRKEGKRVYYNLNHDMIGELLSFLREITTANSSCSCCEKMKGGGGIMDKTLPCGCVSECGCTAASETKQKPDNGCDNPNCYCEPICTCGENCEC